MMNVVDKKPKKDASHVLLGERERTLASAVRRRASSIYFLVPAFQEAGCSCSPHRRRFKELETQYHAERDRLISELDSSDLAKEMGDLRKTIADIDRREHSSLDTVARQAHPFLPVWMLDQVREGNPDVLGLSDQDITSSYAEAWFGGWRPKSLYKARRSGADG
jgi:hypothetical protein